MAASIDRAGPRAPGDPTFAAKPETKKPVFNHTWSRQFPNWLAEQNVSLAFTTYQANMIFLVGLRDDGRLSFFRRAIPRCMGMYANGNALYVSSLYQVWRFENALAEGQQHNGFDRLYVPKVSHVTGDLDIHDMALDADGRLVFVCTLFSCLATTSETFSLKPLWKPPFISKLAAEDRCHMNGLAMRDGRPRWVTTVSEGDVADGWRDFRRNGGTVIDVANNEIVVRGLSMPHSPRWYRGKLWLHNSGTGEFGYVNMEHGRFEPVCFCPGYLRGLDFVSDFAVVGLSQARRERVFTGLDLQDRLEAKKAVPRCGLNVIDLRTGDVVHWARFEGTIQELYDVSVLPQCKRPMAIGFQNDEIRRAISVEPPDAAQRGAGGLQWLAPEEAKKAPAPNADALTS
jgi:uncharacterized protein (TIGR03032 family)